ncbi:MAG: hypothetical protein IJT87_04705 [Ruminiclostridium sp.]|nr:hypothetical protein [Ruminiclostridium sp.]
MKKKDKQQTVAVSEKTQRSTPAQGSSAPIKLELLITIVDKNKAEFYIDLIQSYDVNFQFSEPARGTAKAEILDYLGLADTDKTVIFSVVRSDRLDELMYVLDMKFRTIKNGKGVSVSVPFSSMIGTSVYTFLCNAAEPVWGSNAK